MFDAEKFQQLRAGQFGTDLHYFVDVDSTNRIGAELARQRVSEGAVVLADSQTAGRGRHTHKWYSPAGVNLYFTIVLYPPAERLHYLPFLIAISLAESLEAEGLRCDLKWPNDVLVGDKKIAGVLIQTSMEENRLVSAIAGIGININAKEFPADLEAIATSIFQSTGRVTSREAFLAGFLRRFEQVYLRITEFSWDEITDRISHRSSFLHNCEVQIEQQGNITTGMTAGLDSMGGLILQTQNGREVFYAGEVAACRKK